MTVPQSDESDSLMQPLPSRLLRLGYAYAGAQASYQVSAHGYLIQFGDLREAMRVQAESGGDYGCEVCWGLEDCFASGCLVLTLEGQEPSQVLSLFAGQLAYLSDLFTDGKQVKQFIEFYRLTDAQRALKLMPHLLAACHLCHHDRELLFSPAGLNGRWSEQIVTASAPNNIPLIGFDPNEVVIERILSGVDGRTTCMIRNIPNKYTQSMLIEWLNEDLWGHYDFVYLRMDFKNRCNVGYAFINFAHPQ